MSLPILPLAAMAMLYMGVFASMFLDLMSEQTKVATATESRCARDQVCELLPSVCICERTRVFRQAKHLKRNLYRISARTRTMSIDVIMQQMCKEGPHCGPNGPGGPCGAGPTIPTVSACEWSGDYLRTETTLAEGQSHRPSPRSAPRGELTKIRPQGRTHQDSPPGENSPLISERTISLLSAFKQATMANCQKNALDDLEESVKA